MPEQRIGKAIEAAITAEGCSSAGSRSPPRASPTSPTDDPEHSLPRTFAQLTTEDMEEEANCSPVSTTGSAAATTRGPTLREEEVSPP